MDIELQIHFYSRGELETCVVFPIFGELLPDAGDGTRWDDYSDMSAQVPQAPSHKVSVCQVSVATVKNEYIILMVSLSAVSW